MSDLRLIGYEDGFVLFEAIDGTKYRAMADEALRDAQRKATNSIDTSSYVSPRDIQERIRTGETIAQISETSGSPEEYVAKFAKPVIDELEHMLESAKAVRLTIPGDRFNDESQIEFGTLIQSRLDQAGATQQTWAVNRSGATTWDITVSYQIADNTGLAHWVFDPRKVVLSPENEAAAGLSTVEGASGPISKVRVIADTPAAFRKVEDSPSKSNLVTQQAKVEQPEATIESLDDLRKKREAAKATETKDDEVTEAVEAVAPETVDEPADEPSFDEPLNEPVDEPLEESIESDSTAVYEVDEVVIENDPPTKPINVSEASPEVEPSESPAAKKSRAAMPSWDQIVFGTKSDN